MKQETINKNKLLTILCAVAIILGVLVAIVLFSVTPFLITAELENLSNLFLN